MGPATVRIGECSLGRGLFAATDFRREDLIMVFKGPRYERDDPIHQTREGANLLQTGLRTYILLQEPGVFVNHSCDPNAGIRINRRLVAIRDIVAGEEIRFDYSTTMDEGYWTMECRCGAAHCRGRVTDFHELPDEVRARYLALRIVQGFIARRARLLAAPQRA
jgi:hypothetical protein